MQVSEHSDTVIRMATHVGQTVTVRGTEYRVVGIRHAGECGSKFFGKFVFTLESNRGERFRCLGKAVAHNSKLSAEVSK